MVCPSHKAEGVATEPKKSYPAKVSRDDREVAKLFFLGCVVGLVLNLFYFKTGIGLAIGLLPFMGGFNGNSNWVNPRVGESRMEMDRKVIKWIF